MQSDISYNNSNNLVQSMINCQLDDRRSLAKAAFYIFSAAFSKGLGTHPASCPTNIDSCGNKPTEGPGWLLPSASVKIIRLGVAPLPRIELRLTLLLTVSVPCSRNQLKDLTLKQYI
jgi:hypothetical protein